MDCDQLGECSLSLCNQLEHIFDVEALSSGRMWVCVSQTCSINRQNKPRVSWTHTHTPTLETRQIQEKCNRLILHFQISVFHKHFKISSFHFFKLHFTKMTLSHTHTVQLVLNVTHLFLIINPILISEAHIFRWHTLSVHSVLSSLFAELVLFQQLHSSYHSRYPHRFQFNKSNPIPICAHCRWASCSPVKFWNNSISDCQTTKQHTHSTPTHVLVHLNYIPSTFLIPITL